MAHWHFDTSALVKYYVLEPGSTWVRSIIDVSSSQGSQAAHTSSIASISIAEATAAFAVLYRTGRIRHAAWSGVFNMFMADVIQRFLVIETVRQDFISAAFLTRQHPLKGYDAVQLAVALRYRTVLDTLQLSLTFVSGDRTVLAAAAAEGLPTDNPFDHVSTLDRPPPDRP